MIRSPKVSIPVAMPKCPAISRTTNRLAFGANIPRLGSDRPRQSLDRRQLGIFSIGRIKRLSFSALSNAARGFYAALNRGIELASGEFLVIATCDDTMHRTFSPHCSKHSRFVRRLGSLLVMWPINRDGEQLTREDIARSSSWANRFIMSALDVVRSYLTRILNYLQGSSSAMTVFCIFGEERLLFSYSSRRLRTVRHNPQNRSTLTVGSIADLGWLVRLHKPPVKIVELPDKVY